MTIMLFFPLRLAQKCSHNCTQIKMESKSIYSTTSFTPVMKSGQIKGLKNILYFQFVVRLYKCSTLRERENSEGEHTQSAT